MRFERLKMVFAAAERHIVPIINNTVEQTAELFERIEAYMQENTGISILGRPRMAQQPILARAAHQQSLTQ